MLSTRANENGLVYFPEMVVGCKSSYIFTNALGIVGLKQNEGRFTNFDSRENRKVINHLSRWS